MWLKFFADLGFGIVFLLGFVIMGGYYFWKYNDGSAIRLELENMETERKKIHSEIQTLQVKLQSVQEMDESLKKNSEEINLLFKYIPNTLKSSMILKHLNHLTKASGVHLEDIKNYGSVKKEKLYEKLRISMHIRGFFSQLLLFLSKITELNIFVTVEDFVIEHDAKKAQSLLNRLHELRMSMDIYGYRYLTQADKKKK